jgi:hypothetical protein
MYCHYFMNILEIKPILDIHVKSSVSIFLTWSMTVLAIVTSSQNRLDYIDGQLTQSDPK